MSTYTRSDLVIDFANRQGVTQAEAQAMVDATLDLIRQKIETGHDVSLRRFGSFVLRVTKPRVGRNPNDPGVTVPIPARVTVKFQPSGELKTAITAMRPEKVSS